MAEVKNKTAKKTAWLLFIIALLLSLGAEHFVSPHTPPIGGKLGIENRPYFFAWFGFASCFLIVIVSKILGLLIKRKEDYYKEARDDK